MSIQEVKDFLYKTWNLHAEVNKLAGFEDLNYHVKTDGGDTYLLKISDGGLTAEVEMQVEVLQFMKMKVELHETKDFTARLIEWTSGKPWGDTYPKTPALLRDLGIQAAKHFNKIEDFDHLSTRRENFNWDLAQSLWIKPHLDILDDGLSEKITHFIHRFEDVQEIYIDLPKSTIHNDLNDYNILVDEGKVTGFIDYGDMCYSQRINEVAILLSYAMMGFEDPLDAAVHVLSGFTEIQSLKSEEIEVLYVLIAMRLSVSLVTSQQNIIQRPDNDYLQISRDPALKLLNKLSETSEAFATYKFKAACNISLSDKKQTFEKWAESHEISRVVPLELDDYYTLDLGVGSLELGHEYDYNNPQRHWRQIKDILETKQKSFAIGSYNEIRPLYSSEDFVEIGNEGRRWRTVHIGLDFFQEEGTEVYAFADGEIYSMNYNEGDKNYGHTIIIKHDCFFTLYGHLSAASLQHLSVGQKVKAGSLIAWFGTPAENGNWAPHLHFQIILDMLNYEGDFPGVCHVHERELYTHICPDPRPYLGLKLPEARGLQSQEIEKLRKQKLGRSYSLSYEQPLHIVRAAGQYLYDENGRKYLDCVNNVPHVGHQNIRVVQAAMKQMQLLNTNTRYLHENIVKLASKLIESLPGKLNVCHFVNSGSEANELAIRMARTYTGRNGIVAMEHGYHGNTNLCVDISSYKFNAKGGQGQKDFVQLIPMPDPVRSQNIERFILDQSRETPAAFIHESILSCGGQVVMPEGFFQTYYKDFRDEGMVMIADEVQTGLGRVGSHMWAFEAEDIVPDIVTIGKPFGNGHPLAAVVCTEEIADAFHNGMEYFNTFGGNPVSCSIGLEVLRIIEEEGLQERAFVLGQYIKGELKKIQEEHSIIADVRGRGLFLGWEFADPETLEPLAEKASNVVNEMKRFGILLSTDGPMHNVVKFKPPMFFRREHADYMLSTMRRILGDMKRN
ncbi:aminotransferase class III-fold pyridoxal phosphate-dependent enzyme [Portibacter lacus]|uniref:4-aminobutyrate aminotransferase n=1 Tax=Portibacter lacus TaxID=1099794 RepID=A0AA37WET7_9BACT|nr:aminotransferase class III-fold pyridoxal phosphate-dependent enzyme [Portibacter lacus]GLR17697.1 4-aminobutyrate aminotransferase [Portibacter lacus]